MCLLGSAASVTCYESSCSNAAKAANLVKRKSRLLANLIVQAKQGMLNEGLAVLFRVFVRLASDDKAQPV